jgi:ABC-type multidrug transport system fused ATPase/permease subunit
LNGLCLSIDKGQKVGLCGRTGAGKSTVALALTRIIEISDGDILIDGVNIRQMNLKELRSKLTVIPQDPVLFSDTLRQNLDPEGKFSNPQLLNLLKRAGLDDLLTRGDAGNTGLQMRIEEGGNNVSVGEKQLICICRAILRKNKVVILDEATANIDVLTEQKILRLMTEEF